jgi:MoaA/NifB/PqqE/SkfB family radical SAM enzyme
MVMVFNAPFNNVAVIFIGGGEPKYREKITDLPQVADKLKIE